MSRSFLAVWLILATVLFGSCRFFSEDKDKMEDLPPIFFPNWDPTSTPIPHTPTSVPPTPIPVPPTAIPVLPTPTATPPSLTPVPPRGLTPTVIDPGDQNSLKPIISEVQYILDQSRIAMSDLRSYQFILSGTALLDAGGFPMNVPIRSIGKVEDDNASANFETSLIGMVISVESFQSGSEIYVKDPFMGSWSKSNKPAAGLISYDFWRVSGRDIFNLPFSKSLREKEKSELDYYEFELDEMSEVTTLLGLLGVDGANDFDIKDVTLKMKIKKDSYHVLDVKGAFTIQQGGRFVSEILGLTGLSGLGDSKIDIEVEFMDFGEDMDIVMPVGLK